MKRVVKQKVIPKQVYEEVKFFCESCGHQIEHGITADKCLICGKELCGNCQEIVYTFPDEIIYMLCDGGVIFGYENSELDTVNYFCKDCYEKIKKRKEKYLKDCRNAVDNFNKAMLKAKNRYLNIEK